MPLEFRAARGKLKPQGKPYYKAIGEGLHLGYRKGKVEGKWVVRRYAGNQSYITDTIATADDIEDADGDQVLNFWQAQEKAREIGGKLVYSGPYRVQDALDAYLDHLGPRSEPSSRYRNISCPHWAMFWSMSLPPTAYGHGSRVWFGAIAKRPSAKANALPIGFGRCCGQLSI